jgi:integrase
MTIGKHGSPWTPDAARNRAKVILGEVARWVDSGCNGPDPAEARQQDRHGLTFGGLLDLYFAEGVSHKKASTIETDRGRAENHLRPLLGRLRVDRIGRADIERMRDAVAGGKTAATKDEKRRAGNIRCGGKGTAGKAVGLVSAILTFAVDRKLCGDNPARGIKKARGRKLERFLSEAEIARLADALDAQAAETRNPFPTAAIWLLLLTGCRRGEIIGLEWQNVDFERQCLRFPDSKTGAKVIPLNAPALELLEGLPRVEGNPYVIPGLRAATAGPTVATVWSRVRKTAGLTDVRLHDLRHSYASIAVSGGASLPMIGKLLGHRNAATTERYAHLSDDPLRAVNDMVGERIAAAIKGRASPVVPMRRGQPS